MDRAEQLQLEYLKARLARLDVIIRRELWRWQLAGQDPRDAYRGLYLSDSTAGQLAAQPPFLSWGQTVPAPAGDLATFDRQAAAAEQAAADLSGTARSEGVPLRLEQIAARFGLTPFEQDVLLLALAPALDLRYERLYGFLQDDITRKLPATNLALDLLCGPGTERIERARFFDPGAALFRWGLVEKAQEGAASKGSPLAQPFRASETVAAWVEGRYVPQPGGSLRLLDLGPSDTDRIAGDMAAAALGHLRANEAPILALWGADEAAQLAAARLAAEQMSLPLLAADLPAMVGAGLTPGRAAWLALRDALLVGAAPLLAGFDACLSPENSAVPTEEVMASLAAFPGVVITSSKAQWHWQNLEQHRQLIPVEMPIPGYAQRTALWTHFLGGDHPEIPIIASQLKLTSSQIAGTVRLARDRAALRGEPVLGADLYAAAQVHSNPNLITLARKIIPRYERADIILPPDRLVQMGEIINTVRHRARVLEQWGVGRKLAAGQGVTMLFIGSPGTGKTMAADIIAGELALELYKIDLSSVVSKYIGETEKNLEKIFTEASSTNAILFFDEADALFGKRSEVRDAHDRYANIEISYLLQRMEAYDGVTILATNLRANLDEAFMRRLQFVVEFPFPEEADRLRIWQGLFPAELPRSPDVDFAALAARYKLAGGNIRNIVVSAAYLAAADGGVVTMDHLLHGTRRELQKIGRLVS